MTMRNRQILVAVGLVIVAAWFLFTWLGSSPAPEPTPGPSPTGGIGSAPLTFAPSDSAGPSQTTAASVAPGATAASSPPGGSGNPIVTPAPGATEPPAELVHWSGTWTNTSPDSATGSLDIVWTQDGSVLEGVLGMDGAACFTTGGMQGTIEGDKVAFEVIARDSVSYEGTIAGDSVSGTFTLSCDGSAGTWEATRQP